MNLCVGTQEFLRGHAKIKALRPHHGSLRAFYFKFKIYFQNMISKYSFKSSRNTKLSFTSASASVHPENRW